MDHADEYSAYIVRYLENQLNDSELEQFCVHLAGCIQCKEDLIEERTLSRVLLRSRPLYVAPAGLRARIAVITRNSGSLSVQRRTSTRIFPCVAQLPVRWKILGPTAVLIMILGVVLLPDVIQQVRAMDYVETAVATHRSFLNGNIPLQVRSDSTIEVAWWLADKLAFNLKIPGSESFDGSNVIYRLTGAGLVNYKGGRIALLTYETQKEKISLMVAPEENAAVAGGDEVQCGGLTFHYQQRDAYKVITWSNHGLAYALVSSTSVPSRKPCLVCHQTMTDRDLFKQPR